jgi:hypothetical protein
MRDALFLLLPFVLAVRRSLTPPVPAETEYEALVVVTLCLTGLLLTLSLITWFPDLGAVIANYSQF